ncbi:hypothetical protein J2T12_002282 [Paenibacillus anaericanus]|uniref:hypothetical protein n=1 Tax=Paenibacillus anaericanus TaxID=170367 RepID=UPI00277E7CB6|nr:hypothetical protein [Paenibacillus anaericanus]MDQ0088872.1 hypothetical protein [Paenibacillus anaericanus]
MKESKKGKNIEPTLEYEHSGDERVTGGGHGGSGDSSRPDARDMDRIVGGSRPGRGR